MVILLLLSGVALELPGVNAVEKDIMHWAVLGLVLIAQFELNGIWSRNGIQHANRPTSTVYPRKYLR